jgi:hypothetical protein
MTPTQIATDYAETMNCLRNPDDWDVPSIISDVSQNLMHDGNGKAAAVIDTLMFRMRDIAERISHKHAKRIDPNTLRVAADIADVFVRGEG